MEGVRKTSIEIVLEDFRVTGKTQTLTVDESSKIHDGINDAMRQVKIEFKKMEFESKISADKIVLTIKK